MEDDAACSGSGAKRVLQTSSQVLQDCWDNERLPNGWFWPLHRRISELLHHRAMHNNDIINLGIHQGQTGSIYIQEVLKHECKPPAGSIAASMALLKQVVPLQSYTRSNHPVAHRITGQCPATATQSLFTAKAST